MFAFSVEVGWSSVLAVAAVLGALAVIGSFAAKGYRMARNVEVMVAWVRAEMSPNHGTSLRDVVDRVEAKLGEDFVRLEAHEARFDELSEQIDVLGVKLGRLCERLCSES